MRSRRGTRFTATPPILSLIPSTPSTAPYTPATPTGTENIRVYLVITISIYINIVCVGITRIILQLQYTW